MPSVSGNENPTDVYQEPTGLLAPGHVLGAYRIIKLVGRGGMGAVYEAEHTTIGRRVALKVLKPKFTVDKVALRRFFDEARAVNKIRHPAIIQITDLVEGEDATYIVMELLEGQTLADRIIDGPPMKDEELVLLMRRLTGVLGVAHEAGVIHRDLKPENVFLLGKDRVEGVKLLDFGIAKLRGGEATPVNETAAGTIVGTPAYMSPEQAAGRELDFKTDIYSLGVVLYEVLTDKLPFEGDNFGDFLVAHLSASPEPPSTHRELAPAVDRLVLDCLEKDPADRPGSMAEVRRRVYSAWWHVAPTSNVDEVQSGPFAAAPGPDDFIDVASDAETEPPAPAPEPPTPEPPEPSAAEPAPPAEEGLEVQPPRAAQPRRSAKQRGIVVGAIFGLLIVAGFGLILSQQRGAPPVERKPEATTFNLVVETVPPGANVFRTDTGALMGKTPLKVMPELADVPPKLRLELDGFMPETRSIPTGENVAVSVSLREKVVATRPGVTEPVTTEPVNTKPVTTKPVTTKPVTTKPPKPDRTRKGPKSRILDPFAKKN